jgi:hypothetical protein
MTDRVGFRIVDVELNATNGGSFSITVAKAGSARAPTPAVERVLAQERELRLDTLGPYREFAQAAADSKRELRAFLDQAIAAGKTVAGLGASTKGNVLLQYCGLSEREICCIGEVNPDKFGRYTPGSFVPIVPEEALFERKPDLVLVLPWHFREFFRQNARYRGLRLFVPLPAVEPL